MANALMMRTLVTAIACTLTVCSGGGNAVDATPNATNAKNDEPAILFASATIEIPAAGGTIGLPAIPQEILTGTASAVFPAGPAENVSVTTVNGTSGAPESGPPSGRCSTVQAEKFDFATAGVESSFPALTLVVTSQGPGPYTLYVFDDTGDTGQGGGPLLETQTFSVASSSPGAALTLAFPPVAQPWTIVAGHTYVFAVFGPRTNSCTGIVA